MASTATKTPNPTITLKGLSARAFDRLVSADAILKVAGKDQAERKRAMTDLLATMFVKLSIEAGAKQENPRVATKQSNANLQVKHVSGVSRVHGPAGDLIKLPDQFRGAGFTEETVTEIMAAAIELKSETRMKSFEELAISQDAEKRKIGEQIQAYIARFTSEHQGLMLERTVTETVRPCWKDFSVALAVRLADGDLDRGIEIIGRLWAVLPPQFVIDQMEFGGDKAAAFGELLKG
jgi:hypothetical protein